MGGHGHEKKGGAQKGDKGKSVEPRFNVAEALKDSDFIAFANQYAAINGLDKAALSHDTAKLEVAWKKYVAKKEALDELTKFFDAEVGKDTGLEFKNDPHTSAFLAEANQYLTEVASEEGFDLTKRCKDIKEINKLSGPAQKGKIISLGLQREYLTLGGMVDVGKLLQDERNLNYSQKQQKIKKDLVEFDKVDPIRAFFKRRELKKLEAEMTAQGISLEDPSLDGAAKVKKISKEVQHFKEVEHAIHSDKISLAKDLELHGGKVQDDDKDAQLTKADNRLIVLEKLLKAGRGEQIKIIKKIGLEKRYIIPYKHLTYAIPLFDKINIEAIKRDVVRLRAALTEEGVRKAPLPELKKKKDELQKIKESLLKKKLGSRRALDAAQQAIQENMLWVMSEEGDLADEEKHIATEGPVYLLEDLRKQMEPYPRPFSADAHALDAQLAATERALKPREAAHRPKMEKAEKTAAVFKKAAKNSLGYLPANDVGRYGKPVAERISTLRERRVGGQIEQFLNRLNDPTFTKKQFDEELVKIPLSPDDRKGIFKTKLTAARKTMQIGVDKQRWLHDLLKKL